MRPDDDLVRAAARGEADAWNVLVERHSQLMYANARAVGADEALAQDVVQIAWMRLLNRLDTIREPGRIRGWLAIVTRNEARSVLARRRPTSDVDDLFDVASTTSPAPEAEAIRTDEATAVQRALAAISERCRELLTLLFSAEMSYQEIAATTGMPVGSIGPTRQRCLDGLARRLGRDVRAS